jgi:hypothetical protein
MFLYNWKTIYNHTDGKVKDVVTIFRMLHRNTIPRNKFDPIYRFYPYKKYFIGSSFLLHPDVLDFNLLRASDREIAEYLALAAMRPLADYYVSGKTTLDLFEVPLNLDTLKNNRLLQINYKTNELVFVYEEVPEEKH